jgi:hypothetical protein
MACFKHGKGKLHGEPRISINWIGSFLPLVIFIFVLTTLHAPFAFQVLNTLGFMLWLDLDCPTMATSLSGSRLPAQGCKPYASSPSCLHVGYIYMYTCG